MDLRRRLASGSARRVALAGAVLCLVGFGVGGPGCRGGADVAEPAWLPGSGAVLPERAPTFSGARAVDDARRLAEHPRRAPGSRDAARARSDIEEALHRAGARTEWLGAAPARASGGGVADDTASAPDDGGVGAVLGVLPGRSDDVILLVARYDATEDEAEDETGRLEAASGPAFLLELGRALAGRTRPYTIWLAFVSGDALGERPPPDDPALGFPGSAALASSLARRGDLDRVRLVVFFESLFGPPSTPALRVARDLRSNRIHRESFWDSARALGLDEVFVPDEPFSTPVTGHRALLERNVRSVVVITASPAEVADASGEQGPEAGRGSSEDTTALRLAELGTVVLDALDRIALRLSRIDGFATAPVSGDAWGDGAGADAPRSGVAPSAGAAGPGGAQDAAEPRPTDGGAPAPPADRDGSR